MAGKPHPLLAQIPLTVSPYISLPTAPTLPYTYKSLPSTLPPSSTADSHGQEQDKYVIARSGHTAHPDEILASCQSLQAHIVKVQKDAEQKIKDWEKDLKDQELAEKRRVAPGWLDREEKILQPNRMSGVGSSQKGDSGGPATNLMDQEDEQVPGAPGGRLPDAAGEELDRAFGGITLQKQ